MGDVHRAAGGAGILEVGVMRTIVVLRAVAGVLFLTQLVLGVLFWTGHALALTQLHMALGALFVIGIWTLAVLCARAGAPRAPVVALIALGVVIPIVGVTQMGLLPGPWHWVIRVLHLLLGMAAMPIAGRLPTLLPGRPAV